MLDDFQIHTPTPDTGGNTACWIAPAEWRTVVSNPMRPEPRSFDLPKVSPCHPSKGHLDPSYWLKLKLQASSLILSLFSPGYPAHTDQHSLLILIPKRHQTSQPQRGPRTCRPARGPSAHVGAFSLLHPGPLPHPLTAEQAGLSPPFSILYRMELFHSWHLCLFKEAITGHTICHIVT